MRVLVFFFLSYLLFLFISLTPCYRISIFSIFFSVLLYSLSNISNITYSQDMNIFIELFNAHDFSVCVFIGLC